MNDEYLSDTSGSFHVLITGVSAAPNETDFDVHRPPVLLRRLPQIRNARHKIRRIRPVNQRLQFIQVNFNQLIVLASLVGGEQCLAVVLSGVPDVLPLCGVQVASHTVVKRENGRRGSDFRAHIADGAHAGARDGIHTRAVVLDDGAGAALDGQDSCHLEDNVLRARPAAHFARQLHTDNLKNSIFQKQREKKEKKMFLKKFDSFLITIFLHFHTFLLRYFREKHGMIKRCQTSMRKKVRLHNRSIE